ncbi:hypothetical protein P389DRAFT_187361 [Cystobasidium minutum MCA 4210]|uniref:uncharacterized protein n=1 Tax=Cystobasidium minutum MCA 4210 TaxID=1397322 RepID=UPI0034CDCF0C|eukprot:jgi/Rhomi1/187361/estExt_fgenesh1_pg.C_1_t20170
MNPRNCPVSWCTKQLSGEEPNKHSEDDHKTCKLCEKAIPNYGDCKEYERHIDGCLEKCKNEFDQKERFSQCRVAACTRKKQPYQNFHSYKQHLLTSHTEIREPWRCMHCPVNSPQKFRTTGLLQLHMASAHAKPKTVKCSEAGCTDTFTSEPVMKQHVSKKHKKPDDAGLETSKALEVALLACWQEKGGKCGICIAFKVPTIVAFPTEEALRVHLLECAKAKIPSDSRPSRENPVRCTFSMCETIHGTIKLHVEHTLLNHCGPEVVLDCPFCDPTPVFHSVPNFERHNQEVHERGKKEAGELKCKECGTKFTRREHLKRHQSKPICQARKAAQDSSRSDAAPLTKGTSVRAGRPSSRSRIGKSSLAIDGASSRKRPATPGPSGSSPVSQPFGSTVSPIQFYKLPAYLRTGSDVIPVTVIYADKSFLWTHGTPATSIRKPACL